MGAFQDFYIVQMLQIVESMTDILSGILIILTKFSTPLLKRGFLNLFQLYNVTE